MTGKVLHLLYVDDDESERLFLVRTVATSELPIQLQCVAGAEAGLKVLEARTILPDLILLDIRMPMISGFEFLEIVKRREYVREIPVMMFSNSYQAKDIERARELGADFYYVKPASLDEFGMFIRRLYESWLRSEIPREWATTATPVERNGGSAGCSQPNAVPNAASAEAS